MLIVADDLTGAADSAAPFARAGASTTVVLGSHGAGRSPLDASVVAIDTDGRAADVRTAADATAAAVRAFPQRPVFVKVDSTMRGHLAATVQSALGALADTFRCVVICPAFPALGRTVVDGRVLVDGRPLPGGDVRSTFAELRTDADVEVVLADARTASDLDALVARHHEPAEPGATLWVGSSGLARALVPTVAPDGRRLEVPSRHRVAVVAGSQHERTLAQLTDLDASRDGPVEVFRLDPRDPRCVDRIVPDIAEADGLVMTGGMTARMVLDALGIDRFDVGGEVEVGIPWGIAAVERDGAGRSVAIVTKAGGFGDAGALRRCAEFLGGRRTT